MYKLRLVRRVRKTGFTLLEIMIVVMIIGMLSAITGGMVIRQLRNAQKNLAKTWVTATGAQALEQYYTQNFMFPTTEQGLQALVTKPTSSPAPQGWTDPYLRQLPLDPWNRPYQYRCPGEHDQNEYDLWSDGPDMLPGTADDIGNWQ